MISNIKNDFLTVEINSLGAELVQISSSEENYIWTINEKFWNKTSPVLFPIVGGLKDGKYSYEGKEFQLPRHGFARLNDFEIFQQSETEIHYKLTPTSNTLKVYPFDFELQIGYKLIRNKLVVNYQVINKSTKKMPFSLGAHPAFSIDLEQDNYKILFESDFELITHKLKNELFSGLTEKIALQNHFLGLNYSYFKEDALVLKDFKSKTLTIKKNEKNFLKFNMGNFPYLGIWTKEDAPFLCLEPWFGYADKANSNGNIFEKEGIQVLNPTESFECFFEIEIL